MLIENPMVVDMENWILTNIGKVAAGIPSEDGKNVTIIAIQNADYASMKLKQYAKENKAMILESIAEGDVGGMERRRGM